MNEKELCPFKMAGNRGLWDCEKGKCQLYIASEGKCAFTVQASPIITLEEAPATNVHSKEAEPI